MEYFVRITNHKAMKKLKTLKNDMPILNYFLVDPEEQKGKINLLDSFLLFDIQTNLERPALIPISFLEYEEIKVYFEGEKTFTESGYAINVHQENDLDYPGFNTSEKQEKEINISTRSFFRLIEATKNTTSKYKDNHTLRNLLFFNDGKFMTCDGHILVWEKGQKRENIDNFTIDKNNPFLKKLKLAFNSNFMTLELRQHCLELIGSGFSVFIKYNDIKHPNFYQVIETSLQTATTNFYVNPKETYKHTKKLKKEIIRFQDNFIKTDNLSIPLQVDHVINLPQGMKSEYFNTMLQRGMNEINFDEKNSMFTGQSLDHHFIVMGTRL